MYLSELTKLDGVSGNEQAVRAYIKEKVMPLNSEENTASVVCNF